MRTHRIRTANLLGSNIAITSIDSLCHHALSLASQRRPAYICFATAYTVVEATRKFDLRRAYGNATVVSPDGVPVAWFLRMLGNTTAECVSGPRSCDVLLQEAAKRGTPVGFYGGRQETLDLLNDRLAREIPELRVAYSFSPPFRPLSVEEEEQHVRDIRTSGVRLLFIGLGSPKQDCWMDKFSPQLDCVCLGVGGAFEFLSGEKVLPPLWVQKLGLTWLVRLCQEPRRLMRRNLYSPQFLALGLRWIAMDPSHRRLWELRLDQRMRTPNPTLGSAPQ